MALVSGIIVAGLGGTSAGVLSWPIKLQKKFEFEHCWFPGMIFGLFFLPWAITLLFCPNAIEAYRSVDISYIIKSNLFSLAWGVGNVLLGLSLVRIGASLSFAILSGIGIPIGVIVPMVMKGTGLFQNAPDLNSAAGYAILAATVFMLVGVLFVTFAGFGRDKMVDTSNEKAGTGGFLGGLIMCILSGFCSVGPSFAFIYSQEPIFKAMTGRGAGDWPANISVWALGMLGGGLVNIIYPAFLMSKNRSWNVVKESPKELGLSCIVGLNLFLAFGLMFQGMKLLGPLGASVGFGIYFVMQILGGQGLGLISGEWKGVKGKPVYQMFVAIGLLMVGACIMGYAATL